MGTKDGKNGFWVRKRPLSISRPRKQIELKPAFILTSYRRYDAGIQTFDTANVSSRRTVVHSLLEHNLSLGILQRTLRDYTRQGDQKAPVTSG